MSAAVTCKQKLLHENEIVLYLQNYNSYDVDQGHYKKTLERFTNSTKNPP